MATASTVLTPAEQQQVAHALETDAQILSNTELKKQLAGHSEQTQNEIIRINLIRIRGTWRFRWHFSFRFSPAAWGCSIRSE